MIKTGLHHALTLNNHGVMLLLENKDQQAVKFFHQSLQSLNQSLAHGDINNRTFNDKEQTTDDHSRSHPTTHRLPSLQHSSFYLYNNALTFSLDSIGNTFTDSMLHWYIVAISLNIALAFHRLSQSGFSSSAIRKAEKMYKIVLTAADALDEMALIFKLGATNNLALIRYDKDDHEGAHEGFLKVSESMQVVGNQVIIPSSEEEHIVFELTLNVLCSMPPQAAKAA